MSLNTQNLGTNTRFKRLNSHRCKKIWNPSTLHKTAGLYSWLEVSGRRITKSATTRMSLCWRKVSGTIHTLPHLISPAHAMQAQLTKTLSSSPLALTTEEGHYPPLRYFANLIIGRLMVTGTGRSATISLLTWGGTLFSAPSVSTNTLSLVVPMPRDSYQM